jgi:twitching motility protein PilT
MTLVPSLLQSIVLMDGEALVLHVGDRPYVVAESGQVSLSNTGLTATAITEVLDELLPVEASRALADVGATQCVLPPNPLFPTERFSVVAARGGDDVWVEIRRTPTDSARAALRDRGDMHDPSVGSIGTVVAPFEPPGDERPGPVLAEADHRARDFDTTELALDDTSPAVVLPLTRTPLRADVPPPLAEPALSGIDRLLRMAAVRGASTLYLSSGTRPSIRIDGEVQTLEGAALMGPNDVESLLLTLMPERSAEALRSGAASEWISEFPDLGRVRCLSFRDYRGPGGVFRMIPPRTVTADQLGLSREIQGLANEIDGLVIVTGPRLSGKRTLMSAFIDHINRTRHVRIVTVEREINTIHERIGSIVSQRESHGPEAMSAAVRGALREDPDVLLVEDVRAAELVNLAIDAAAGGRLVICGFPARGAAAAIDGIIDLSPPQERLRVQLLLAQNLRGVVAQVLLKKSGGGRLAARELLLNTPPVAGLLAEGKTSQLPLAIEGGRKHGMVPLNDALGGFVQSGAVDVREAYRCAADRQGLVALLQRQGIDVSTVERLA